MNSQKGIDTMTATNKKDALRKLNTLASALADVGVASSVWEDEECGMIRLDCNLWNCCDGTDTPTTFWFEDVQDYECPQNCIEPVAQSEALFAELQELVNNW